ncbi:MAG: ComEC family competence protein, partial [Bacteroidales bacterium]|nr:ComEC family competence protein [Bacteroidales bacterium]
MKHNFVKVFHTTPIFKFLIPLIAGIVTSQITVFSTSITITFILISLLSAFYFTIKQNYYTPGWYYSMLLFFFSLGIGIVKIHTYNNWNIENFRESIYWIGEVRSLAEPTAYGQRYKLRILYYKKDEQWKASKINVLLYIKRNLNIEPEPGQYICLSEKIQELFIPPSSDQTQSYKNYLTQNIVGKIFIDSRNEIMPMPFRSSNLNSQIQLFRNNILKQTGSFFKSTDEKSIFHSLFFGYRSEMDTELTNAYATAGVIHILSVSGLHV